MLTLFLAHPSDLADAAHRDRADRLLPAREQEQWRRFRFETGKQQSLATRTLIRLGLSAMDPATRPQDWTIEIGERGKPFVAEPARLRFNLSNAPGLVVCLISDAGEVGVDVEPHGRAEKVLPLAGEVFSEAEQAQLAALPAKARADRALTLWTLKEAYIKARGEGLAIDLKLFSFVFEPDGGARLEIDRSLGDRAERWRFGWLDHEGHRLALMVEAGDETELRMWEFAPLPDAPRTVELGGVRWFCAAGR